MPCFSFNENFLFSVYEPDAQSFLGKAQKAFQRTFKFSVPILWGNGLPLQPLRVTNDLYVAEPLAVPHLSDAVLADRDALAAEVDKLHA